MIKVNKYMLFEYPQFNFRFYTKTIRVINKWLEDNCIEIDNHDYIDGVGNYGEYVAFKLKTGEYCIVLSDEKGEYLRQTIVKLNDSEIKEIEVHKWLKDKITIN